MSAEFFKRVDEGVPLEDVLNLLREVEQLGLEPEEIGKMRAKAFILLNEIKHFGVRELK